MDGIQNTMNLNLDMHVLPRSKNFTSAILHPSNHLISRTSNGYCSYSYIHWRWISKQTFKC